MVLDIKQNINKIDFDLKKLFENVYITEKAEKGSFYVEISANKMFLFEDCKKRVEVKCRINKNDLHKSIINWTYSLNPLDEKAETIQKTSYINDIAKDIYDIASNKRMIKEYFSSLESHVDLINEECTTSPLNDELHTFDSIISKYGKIVETQTTYENWMNFYLEETIKMSDKFRLETDLLNTGRVSYVSFDDKSVKLTITK